MRSLLPFAILIVFGVLSLITRQLWLFIIPAIFVGIILIWPSRNKEGEESTEEVEYESSEEEKEKMKDYADAFPSTSYKSEQDQDDDFDFEDDEDIFADIDLDFDDDDFDEDLEKEDSKDYSPSLENDLAASDDLSDSLEDELQEEFEEFIVEPEEKKENKESKKETNEDEFDFNDLLFDEVMNDTEVNPQVDSIEPTLSNAFIEDDDNDGDINLFIPENFVKEDEKDKGLDEIKEKALKDLDNLIGMDDLKAEIKRVVKFLEVEKKRELAGKKTKPITLHMVFTGDAGTGKTTVARIIGELLKGIGILESGHFIETDRSGLVASYVGQTGEKTKELVQQAMGGVLFIDEAYALANGGKDDFGQEAIDTLIKEMEDYRDKFVCILAGYDEDMKHLFSKNQGFESRVRYHFHFPNYTVDELVELTLLMMKGMDMKPTDEAKEKIRQYLERKAEKDGYVKGNGRTVRNLIDEIHVNQNNRISDTGIDDFDTVLTEDIPSIEEKESEEMLELLLN